MKIYCAFFLEERTVRISIGKEFSNAISLLSGVPQGSVLSPTLYTLYTNDLPQAEFGCTDIMYADDITQIITTPSKSKWMMKAKVERDIERINTFERKWKIKTSEEKFKIIPIAQMKPKKIMVNGKEIETTKTGKLLGLHISVTGLVSHITKTINKGRGIITQLRRFQNLTPKWKAILIKTLLIPVLEYPAIPVCVASISQKKKMQVILKFIHSNELEHMNTKELHDYYNITPLNISNHCKAQKIWEAIRASEIDHYNILATPRNNTHTWFPKSSYIIRPEPQQAIIT